MRGRLLLGLASLSIVPWIFAEAVAGSRNAVVAETWRRDGWLAAFFEAALINHLKALLLWFVVMLRSIHVSGYDAVLLHPYHHALSSVRKWGGVVEDYQAIHNWIDGSKMILADFRHRCLRHHAEGFLWPRPFSAKQ